MVVVGLLVLRVKEPNLNRPYRVWIVTPILFASTALFLIVLSCFSKPLESLAAFCESHMQTRPPDLLLTMPFHQVFISAGAVPWYVRKKAHEHSKLLFMTIKKNRF